MLGVYVSWQEWRQHGFHNAISPQEGDSKARRRMLRDPPEILLTTPESLEAVMISVRVDHRILLGNIRSVVVDELHAFAGDDRGWHLRFLLARLERLAHHPIRGAADRRVGWLAADQHGGQRRGHDLLAR